MICHAERGLSIGLMPIFLASSTCTWLRSLNTRARLPPMGYIFILKKLRKRNINATEESAHQFGTTFDISYTKFICDSMTVARTQEDLKNLLGEVLKQLRDNFPLRRSLRSRALYKSCISRYCTIRHLLSGMSVLRHKVLCRRRKNTMAT